MNVFINKDGLVEIEAAFSRADICGAVMGNDPVEVTVIGLLTTGQNFFGTDTIRITNQAFDHNPAFLKVFPRATKEQDEAFKQRTNSPHRHPLRKGVENHTRSEAVSPERKKNNSNTWPNV
jgi:hypothetical protein